MDGKVGSGTLPQDIDSLEDNEIRSAVREIWNHKGWTVSDEDSITEAVPAFHLTRESPFLEERILIVEPLECVLSPTELRTSLDIDRLLDDSGSITVVTTRSLSGDPGAEISSIEYVGWNDLVADARAVDNSPAVTEFLSHIEADDEPDDQSVEASIDDEPDDRSVEASTDDDDSRAVDYDEELENELDWSRAAPVFLLFGAVAGAGFSLILISIRPFYDPYIILTTITTNISAITYIVAHFVVMPSDHWRVVGETILLSNSPL